MVFQEGIVGSPQGLLVQQISCDLIESYKPDALRVAEGLWIRVKEAKALISRAEDGDPDAAVTRTAHHAARWEVGGIGIPAVLAAIASTILPGLEEAIRIMIDKVLLAADHGV